MGLGIDLVAVESFRQQLEDSASRFIEGTFTATERRQSQSRPGGDAARHLAARFAAKEAFVKAWSSEHYGQAPRMPRVDMRGELARQGGPRRLQVSLSHDGDFATAVVFVDD